MRRHLQYNWYKYLAVIVLPALLWGFVFELSEKPKADERVRILFVGDQLEVAALQKELQATLPSLSAQPLREITVTQATPGALSFHEFLVSNSFRFDILIFSEPWMQENIGQSYFSQLPQEAFDDFSDAALYQETIDGVPLTYGCFLGSSSRFCRYYRGNERCCLFFSPELDELYVLVAKAAQYLLEVPS